MRAALLDFLAGGILWTSARLARAVGWCVAKVVLVALWLWLNALDGYKDGL